jgi:hypothetical protein
MTSNVLSADVKTQGEADISLGLMIKHELQMF